MIAVRKPPQQKFSWSSGSSTPVKDRALGWLFFAVFASGWLQIQVASAHELADGVVERDLQVVVFPDRVEFQYSFEMNLATMRKCYEQLKRSESLPENERQAWDVFREKIASSLAERIKVSIAGKHRSLKLKSSETVEKHSIKLAHVFVCDFTAEQKPQTIEIKDKNFSESAGYHRVAIKGRRGVEIGDSTAPVIVSHQLRNAWEKMSKQDKETRVHVRASVSLKSSK